MLLICTPYADKIMPETVESVMNLINYLGGTKNADWARLSDCYVDKSRVRLSKVYADEYLFVDSDIAFSINDFSRLRKVNLPIVSGAYKSRKYPNSIVAGTFKEEYIYNAVISENTTGLVSCDWVGTGFLYIKRTVFDTFGDFPPFQTPWVYEEDEWRKVGEDIFFCKEAAKRGYDICVDCDCRVEHLTRGDE